MEYQIAMLSWLATWADILQNGTDEVQHVVFFYGEGKMVIVIFAMSTIIFLVLESNTVMNTYVNVCFSDGFVFNNNNNDLLCNNILED